MLLRVFVAALMLLSIPGAHAAPGSISIRYASDQVAVTDAGNHCYALTAPEPPSEMSRISFSCGWGRQAGHVAIRVFDTLNAAQALHYEARPHGSDAPCLSGDAVNEAQLDLPRGCDVVSVALGPGATTGTIEVSWSA